MEEQRRVLLVSAHADDAFMGAGGYVSKLKKCKAKTCHVVFTLSEKDNGIGFTAEELKKELDDANNYMKIDERYTYRFPVHFLPENGQRIRLKLEYLRAGFQPNIILIPSLNDNHQDHVAVAEEAIRIFRNSETVLSYELLRNSISRFNPNVYVDVSDEIDEKLASISCFKTQEKRPYMKLENFKALAKVRGTQINVGYAEAFEAVKIIF